MLTDKEMSESDIASALNIPLNTVGYNIDKLLKADKDIIIGEFHNFFSSYKSNYLKELEQEIARGFSDEETKEIFQIFHTFLKKYNENICWNIESFVEQYKGD